MRERIEGIDITSLGAVGDDETDCTTAFAEAAQRLAACTYGTIHVPEGVYRVRAPVRIAWRQSLQLAPMAKIKADPAFEGEALVVKGGEGKPSDAGGFGGHDLGGSIRGGIFDANRLPIVGIQVPWGARYAIRETEVLNARAGGIHLGAQGWYEATLQGVRIALDVDGSTPYEPGSVGLKIDRISDNHVSQVLVIGYETGVHATGSSTAFHQVHVWNGKNRPFLCGFHAAGWQDTYSQCQVDAFDGVAYRVAAPFQRFIGCMCQAKPKFGRCDGLIGFELGARATHCTFLGNYFNANKDAEITAFRGSDEGITALGNLYTGWVTAGRWNRVPSDEGGTAWIPPFEAGGQAQPGGHAT